MHSGFLNVFHDAGNHHRFAIADAIDIHFGRVFQKTVNQNGLPLSHNEGFRDKTVELGLVVTNFHRPSSENEARPHKTRKADGDRFGPGLIHRPGNAVGRLFKIQPAKNPRELLTVFSRFNGIDAGADDRNAGIVQGSG